MQKDIDLARADLFPQTSLSTSISAVDDITALSYQGAQGQINWLGSGNVSQVILGEPQFANVAIQKMLKKSEEYYLKQTQLDLIIDLTSAYLNVLQAQQNLRIQQQNVSVTKDNFDISKAKEAIGYIGASDLNRWKSELALGNINLNDAYATLRQAKFHLNQLLNRPINEPFNLEEVTLESQMLMISDGRLQLVDNYGTLDKFADFLVAEGMKKPARTGAGGYGHYRTKALGYVPRKGFLPASSLLDRASQPGLQ